MGIVVLDEAGHLKAFAREDGASMFRFEVAQAKAVVAAALLEYEGMFTCVAAGVPPQ